MWDSESQGTYSSENVLFFWPRYFFFSSKIILIKNQTLSSAFSLVLLLLFQMKEKQWKAPLLLGKGGERDQGDSVIDTISFYNTYSPFLRDKVVKFHFLYPRQLIVIIFNYNFLIWEALKDGFFYSFIGKWQESSMLNFSRQIGTS